MKKLLSVLVCLLIVFAPVVVGAQPDDESLEEYIREVYGLEPGEYQLETPWVMEMDGLSYYIYYIYAERSEDYSKGDIVWLEQEQRFLDGEEFQLVMEDYYERQQKYWEEMQRQAGKMDAWLYSQLLEMDRDEEVEIYILSHFELTSELEQEIRELFLKYDLDPPEDLRWWAPGVTSSSREPAGAVPPGEPEGQDGQDGTDSYEDPDTGDSDENDGDGQSDSEDGYEGDSDSDGQGQDSDDGTADAEEPDDDGDFDDDQTDPYTGDPGDEDGRDGDGDWDVWVDPVDEEFYNELARLYAKGFDASRQRLEASLKAAGAEYSFDGMGFMVTTTAGFALDLRDNEDVDWIGGLFYAYADDSRESMPAVVTGLRDAAYNLQLPSGFETPWFLIGGFGLVMAGLVYLVIKKF